MNLNDPRHPWSRLVRAARRTPRAGDERAPYGFSTRVAALAFAQPRRGPSFVDRFALRALGIAALLALASVVLNYRSVSAAGPDNPDDRPLATEDAMSVLLDT